MHWVQVISHDQGNQVVLRADWCQSFLCRLRGLTFRHSLAEGEGLLLVDSRETISNAGIHMWMVFMSLGVIWINDAYQVVDTVVAKPWRFYFPSRPARYVLEGNPSILELFSPGDQLEFIHEV